MQVLNSTIGSSLPSGAINYIAKDFHITQSEQLVLPISLFLLGYVIGPLIYGPLSEQIGRRWPLISGYLLFSIFTMACALAPSLPALLVFRLLEGMAAAAPISIVSGVYADLYTDPTERGRIMAYFMAVSNTWLRLREEKLVADLLFSVPLSDPLFPPLCQGLFRPSAGVGPSGSVSSSQVPRVL